MSIRLLRRNTQPHRSSSATYLLWETADGALVESSMLYISGRDPSWVCCLPSSVGCSLGCTICAMPSVPSPRFLTASELQAILDVSLAQTRAQGRLQVSFMGQGEPLLRPDGVFDFAERLLAAFPDVVIGVSTVGIASGVKALLGRPWVSRVKLQLSLHAWPPARRRPIIPAEVLHPFEDTLEILRQTRIGLPHAVCLNCVLLQGVNDSVADAAQVAEVAGTGPFRVKLSGFNWWEGSGYAAASETAAERYASVLRLRGIPVRRFESLGTAIGAGCGQTRLCRQMGPQGEVLFGASGIPKAAAEATTGVRDQAR